MPVSTTPWPGPYYAEGEYSVFQRPKETIKEDGSRSITMGFKLLAVGEYVVSDVPGMTAADDVALAMNKGEHADALAQALRGMVEAYWDDSADGPDQPDAIIKAMEALGAAGQAEALKVRGTDV